MSTRPRLTEVVQKGLHLGRAIRLVWSITPGWAVINAVLVVVQGLLPLLSPYFLKRTVDALQAGIAAQAGLAAFRPVLFWVILAAAAALLTALLGSLAGLAGQFQSMVFSDKVTDIVHSRSVAVDLEYYENPSYYDTLQRAQVEAASRPIGVVNRLIGIGRSAVSLAGVAGLLFAFSPLVALVLFCVALPGALVQSLYARRQYSLELEQTEKDRQASYYHFLLTGNWFAKEVRLFNLGSLFRSRFQTLRQQLRGARLALSRRRTLAGLSAQTLTFAAIFGSLAFIAYQVCKGTATLGTLVMYYAIFQLAVTSFSSVLNGVAGLYEDNLFLSNFYKFLDLKPKVLAPANPLPVPTRIVPADSGSPTLEFPLRTLNFGREGLAFHDVSFAYPGSSRRVLDAVNLTVAPGQVIALVGENGSGKTTLVKLLCRLYDPDSGTVTIDGTDIRRLDPVEWRQEISVILQDYVQYSMTAWENIWLGDARTVPDRQKIIEAAQAAGADPAIRRLPQGYDTPLGYQFKRGRELSIGEWQKVALARAFMRDSGLVVLDEPTSSLDPLAEAELFTHFRRAIHGRSAVLISHRFSTVRMADYIYVLDHGRVAESGTHQELLNLGGLYARLYSAQAARYQETGDGGQGTGGRREK
jgi:ATP-binding cassette subfamily B protein